MKQYLERTNYFDFNHQDIIDFVSKTIDINQGKTHNSILLYNAIRDGYRYSPYHVDLRKSKMIASSILKNSQGNCIEKACLLITCCRAIGIPSRLHLVDVRNHIATEKLEQFLGSNLLVCHGYAELYLSDKWVAATPAFNKELCALLDVAVLEFDGKNDSIFQEFDRKASLFMKYETDRGTFSDLPLDYIIATLKNHYPHLFNIATPKEIQFIIDND